MTVIAPIARARALADSDRISVAASSGPSSRRRVRALLADLWADESGHNFMEYAMLISLISMTIFSAIQLTADKVRVAFEALATLIF